MFSCKKDNIDAVETTKKISAVYEIPADSLSPFSSNYMTSFHYNTNGKVDTISRYSFKNNEAEKQLIYAILVQYKNSNEVIMTSLVDNLSNPEEKWVKKTLVLNNNNITKIEDVYKSFLFGNVRTSTVYTFDSNDRLNTCLQYHPDADGYTSDGYQSFVYENKNLKNYQMFPIDTQGINYQSNYQLNFNVEYYDEVYIDAVNKSAINSMLLNYLNIGIIDRFAFVEKNLSGFVPQNLIKKMTSSGSIPGNLNYESEIRFDYIVDKDNLVNEILEFSNNEFKNKYKFIYLN